MQLDTVRGLVRPLVTVAFVGALIAGALLETGDLDKIKDHESRGRGDWGSGQGGSGLGGSGDFGFDPSDRSGNRSRYD